MKVMKVRDISLCLFVLLCIFVAWDNAAGSQIRKVSGKIVAIEAAAQPPTIVVKTTIASGKPLIMGYRLDAGTKIRIGQRSASLAEIHTGDRVGLTYERVEDGLVARLIEKK